MVVPSPASGRSKFAKCLGAPCNECLIRLNAKRRSKTGFGGQLQAGRIIAASKNACHVCAARLKSKCLQGLSLRSGCLLDRADGKAGDEAVKEQVVHERDRKASDQAGGHQRSPVVDISAN